MCFWPNSSLICKKKDRLHRQGYVITCLVIGWVGGLAQDGYLRLM